MNGASASSKAELGGAGDCSQQIMSMKNDGIEVKLVDENCGKGVFATKSFKTGDEVLGDLPIVTCQFAWNQFYKYKACDYCMRALETAEENVTRLTQVPALELPHPECCETKKELQVSCNDCPTNYCSVECKDKAYNEYHKILCYHSKDPPDNVRVLEEYWRSIHLPPETSNIMLLVRLLVRLHLDVDGKLHNRLSEFCQSSTSEDEDLAHKMLGDEYSGQILRLRELVANVASFSNIQQWLTPEGFLKLFILMGRNTQGVGTSSFAAYVANVEQLSISEEEKKSILDRIDNIYDIMDKVVGHFMDNDGVAIYPFQSWVNHSCIPNCEVRFPEKNHRIGLLALRDIEMGEEISISYLDLADITRSRYSRNKFLKEHYLFECKCTRCLDQMDDEEITTTEDEDDDEDEMCTDDDEDEEEMV